MSLRDALEHVLKNYKYAKDNEIFSKNPMAQFLRNDLVSEITKITPNKDYYLFKGSPGQGIWARGPWVGIFNPIRTSSAQDGYYVSYLFREDFEGVYLSLNQAMTEAKRNYKSDAITSLEARARNFRAMLGSDVGEIKLTEIDLAPSHKTNDTFYYQAGNILAKAYLKNSLPSDDELHVDLMKALELYERLIIAEVSAEEEKQIEGDEPATALNEDATKFRIHKRVERNAKLAREAKRVHGYACQACGFNFESVYGELGKEYIEAHHLEPISQLKGTKVSRDPKKDFSVLCSNCHRMIHKSGFVGDVEKFKITHLKGK